MATDFKRADRPVGINLDALKAFHRSRGKLTIATLRGLFAALRSRSERLPRQYVRKSRKLTKRVNGRRYVSRPMCRTQRFPQSSCWKRWGSGRAWLSSTNRAKPFHNPRLGSALDSTRRGCEKADQSGHYTVVLLAPQSSHCGHGELRITAVSSTDKSVSFTMPNLTCRKNRFRFASKPRGPNRYRPGSTCSQPPSEL